MSKLLSKVTISLIAIAVAATGTFYFTSASKGNTAVANNDQSATLVSVWDKETELDYS